MSAPTAVSPAAPPYDAGSTRAPWNQPEVETVTDSDLQQSTGERMTLAAFIVSNRKPALPRHSITPTSA